MSKKIQKPLYFLVLFFWSPVFGTTLMETTAGAGIANTLQGAQPANPQQIINNVKKTVNQIPDPPSLAVNQGANTGASPEAVRNPDGIAPPQQFSGSPTDIPTVNPVSESPAVPAVPGQVSGSPADVPPGNPVLDSPADSAVPVQVSGSPDDVPPANPVLDSPADSAVPVQVSGSPDDVPPANPVLDSPADSAVPVQVSGSPDDVPISSQMSDISSLGEDLEEQDVNADFYDGEITANDLSVESNVKYNSKTVIFYKKDCESPADNCERSHPVFTNLKSVIFDYNHNRLDFQK